MKTTLRIDDEVLKDLKVLAAGTGRSMTGLIEDAVRTMVRQRKRARAPKAFRLATFKGRGRRPGVDIDDTSALMDLTSRTS
jgi:predicted transcriptional regulator